MEILLVLRDSGGTLEVDRTCPVTVLRKCLGGLWGKFFGILHDKLKFSLTNKNSLSLLRSGSATVGE
jgi:hypothetical protein